MITEGKNGKPQVVVKSRINRSGNRSSITDTVIDGSTSILLSNLRLDGWTKTVVDKTRGTHCK